MFWGRGGGRFEGFGVTEAGEKGEAESFPLRARAKEPHDKGEAESFPLQERRCSRPLWKRLGNRFSFVWGQAPVSLGTRPRRGVHELTRIFTNRFSFGWGQTPAGRPRIDTNLTNSCKFVKIRGQPQADRHLLKTQRPSGNMGTDNMETGPDGVLFASGARKRAARQRRSGIPSASRKKMWSSIVEAVGKPLLLWVGTGPGGLWRPRWGVHELTRISRIRANS